MKMPKFKIGQKVRIIKWEDMPQDLWNTFGQNTYGIGIIGTIKQFVGVEREVNSYNIILNNSSHFALEPELESVIKVGEQLLFDFAKE